MKRGPRGWQAMASRAFARRTRALPARTPTPLTDGGFAVLVTESEVRPSSKRIAPLSVTCRKV